MPYHMSQKPQAFAPQLRQVSFRDQVLCRFWVTVGSELVSGQARTLARTGGYNG
jgi:hypothetical protein